MQRSAVVHRSVPARLRQRVWGLARVLTGLFFVSSGLPKLTDHALWVADFARWQVPLPDLAVYGVGGLEVVGGILLATGIVARPVAALLAATMAGALIFAGTRDGASHVVLPLLLGGLTATVAVRGGGAWQLRPASPRAR